METDGALSENDSRTGRDGRTIDTSNIGKRKAEEPDDEPAPPSLADAFVLDEPEEEEEESDDTEPAATIDIPPQRPQFGTALRRAVAATWRQYGDITSDMLAAQLHAIAADIADGAFDREAA
jgi:hypothetical protein